MDPVFWVGVWTGWRQALVIISPDTVLRWQRRRFREYWTQLSGRHSGGRPRISAEIAALIRKMAAANPLWGAPRIHGELLKLGIDVAERTVSRLLPKRRFALSDLADVPRQPPPRPAAGTRRSGADASAPPNANRSRKDSRCSSYPSVVSTSPHTE
jgi:transposase